MPGAALLVAEDQELIADLLVVLPEHLDADGRRATIHADLVVEISSPSTRRRDLGRKRPLYEAAGVAEYWFVDRDRAEVLIHRLGETGAYKQPARRARVDTLTSPQLPGLALALAELLSG